MNHSLISEISKDYCCILNYSTVHLDFLGFGACCCGLRTALVLVSSLSTYSVKEKGSYRIASSNTLFKFLWVRAEHSKYLCARISLATTLAWSYVTGSILLDLRDSLVGSSSRRSNFVPTRMIGTPGAWWEISGNHLNSIESVEHDHIYVFGRSQDYSHIPLLERYQRMEG